MGIEYKINFTKTKPHAILWLKNVHHGKIYIDVEIVGYDNDRNETIIYEKENQLIESAIPIAKVETDMSEFSVGIRLLKLKSVYVDNCVLISESHLTDTDCSGFLSMWEDMQEDYTKCKCVWRNCVWPIGYYDVCHEFGTVKDELNDCILCNKDLVTCRWCNQTNEDIEGSCINCSMDMQSDNSS